MKVNEVNYPRKESMSVAEFYQHWNQDAQRALSY